MKKEERYSFPLAYIKAHLAASLVLCEWFLHMLKCRYHAIHVPEYRHLVDIVELVVSGQRDPVVWYAGLRWCSMLSHPFVPQITPR